MTVQLLDQWLLNEQEQIRKKYQDLNRISIKDPDVLFLGDSIVEYFPLYELLKTPKTVINRGIRGYRSDLLLEYLDSLLFGQAVDKIFLLIGTNDIGKEIPQQETVKNVESIIQTIARNYPLAEICLLSVLPVNESPTYKKRVHLRSNRKIQSLNHVYQELTSAYMNVTFVNVYDSLLDEAGQLAEAFTTDGLHLTVAGYQVLAGRIAMQL
ncbi:MULTISPECIES: SGNH/GDSL hydrolase family protein [Streptococcus]|uniref:SGNH/GDSL hydrolase family protein n=1 Tax=Streptococcus TaxID=1301 RepID=UPI000F6F0D29|nr:MULTISPECIES: SGNH/GDSL hydrolase family protein [Streptococcus]MDK6972520.1 SGNH/GDSL hydrolase family protein [Streptococcus constellatus]VEE79857.1 GDSL family lipase/acylhydrolase [Streptococcus milleri]